MNWDYIVPIYVFTCIISDHYIVDVKCMKLKKLTLNYLAVAWIGYNEL